MTPLCAARIGGCGACGLSFDPWRLRGFLENRPVRGLRASDCEVFCEDNKPDVLYPTPGTPVLDEDGNECGFAAPWFDELCPDVSDRALGFKVRDFTIESASELTGSRNRKAAAANCTVTNGRRFVEITVESVACDAEAEHLLFCWLKRVESQPGCCGTEVDFWRWCCGDKSGRRQLRDVKAFLVEEDTGATPMTRCGKVYTVTFSAGPDIVEPDEYVDGTINEPFDECRPACPTTRTELRPKSTPPRQCFVQTTFYAADNEWRGCLTNCDDYDPTVDQLVFLDTIERVEADTEKCCPVGLTLDMWTNNTPEVAAVPGQESLFASLLAQAADGGINCLCQPAVTLVRQRNNGFDPTCDNCDPNIRAVGCVADIPELEITGEGFIVPPSTGTFTWDLANKTTGDAGADAWVKYVSCMKGQTPNQLADACVAGGGSAAGMQILIDPSGGTGFIATASGGGSTCSAPCQLFCLNLPGSQVAAGETELTLWPGVDGTGCADTGDESTGPNPINTDLQNVINCLNEPPAENCIPYVDVQPTGSQACVVIDLAPGATLLTWELNGEPVPVNADLSNAAFVFAPCQPTAETEECPPIVPDDPKVFGTFTSNTTLTFAPFNDEWEIGAAFPNATSGSNYTLCETDKGPNNADPIITMEPAQVPIDTGVSCEPPCPRTPRRYPRPVGSKWDECAVSEEVQVITGCVDGLNPQATYELVLSGAAVEQLEFVETAMFALPAGLPGPDVLPLESYWCGTNPLRVLRWDANEQFTSDGSCRTMTCNGMPQDVGAGWAVAPQRPLGDGRVCGTDKAWFVMLVPDCCEIPELTFGARCLGK